MKKLDEIMELMTDEMADFKADILKFEVLSNQLSTLSIPISTEVLEKNLNIFLEKQKEENGIKDEIIKEIEKKLKHARIIPNYLLILVCSLSIISLSLLGYFVTQFKKQRKKSLNFIKPLWNRTIINIKNIS